MALEPAEEAEAVSRPTGVVEAHQIAACGQTPAALQQKIALGIQSAVLPGGKRLPLLKTLLTSACERDCYYCPFRAGRNFRRVTFKPEEMARVFIELHQAGTAEGLFLSSGIAGGGVRTQDRLLDTAAILRRRHAYRGYLHLKLMPGVEREQVLQAMRLADRVSTPSRDKGSRLLRNSRAFCKKAWLRAPRRVRPKKRRSVSETAAPFHKPPCLFSGGAVVSRDAALPRKKPGSCDSDGNFSRPITRDIAVRRTSCVKTRWRRMHSGRGALCLDEEALSQVK